MRALITGQAGFLGRHFTAELKERGWIVDGFDIEDDYDFSSNLFAPRSGVDLVIHCAAHVGGRAGIDGVNTNYLKNTIMDAQLFDWAVKNRDRVKRVLYISSSAVYPQGLQDWGSTGCKLVESDYHPANAGYADALYGFGKAQGERMADVARDNGVAVTVVRPFSGYGEDQSLDYPFPSIVNRAREGDLTVWGPPGQTRDWIHVSDVVRGALAVVDSGATVPVNICTGVGWEMGNLAQAVYGRANKLQWHDRQVTYDESKPTGVFYRVGDPTRFNQYYTPEVTLEEGIDRALRGVQT